MGATPDQWGDLRATAGAIFLRGFDQEILEEMRGMVVTQVHEPAVAQTGARGYTDPLEMIAGAEIDGLVVASPTTSHPAQAIAADRHKDLKTITTASPASRPIATARRPGSSNPSSTSGIP